MDNNDLKNFEFLSKYISENDILVDVGSNHGDYTTFFKNKLNGTGLIYSIELDSNNFLILENKFKNDKNIKLFNNAVSNTDELITLYKGRDAYTHNIIGHDMDFKPNEQIGKIKGLRLDTLLKNESIVSLIKIDVEGAELLVLQGMEDIIHKVKNILVECHLNEHWDDIKDLLINSYKLYCINIGTSEIITNKSTRAYQCFCKNLNL